MKLDLRVLLLLLPMSGGCSWLPYAAENVACAPVDWIQERAFHHHMQQLAREAWQQVEHHEGTDHSHAYVSGFKTGFVDYIESNGTGEPPAMPPNKLQCAGFRTPNAQNDIADWFNGFRHGTRVARESGLRDRFVIPISQQPRPVVGEPVPAESTKAPSDVFPPMPVPDSSESNKSPDEKAPPPPEQKKAPDEKAPPPEQKKIPDEKAPPPPEQKKAEGEQAALLEQGEGVTVLFVPNPTPPSLVPIPTPPSFVPIPTPPSFVPIPTLPSFVPIPPLPAAKSGPSER